MARPCMNLPGVTRSTFRDFDFFTPSALIPTPLTGKLPLIGT